jgi:hypothetical protein
VPDRLPSLLVGFWIPPAVAGWVAAGGLRRSQELVRVTATRVALAAFVPGYAAAWFAFNLHRMPPYIPVAAMDPTYASPRATAGLALVAAAFVLPGSALACFLAYRKRMRMR